MHPSSEQMSVEEALAEGIAALRAGDRTRARSLLQYAIQRDPNNEAAWLWLSGAVTTDAERRRCLERVLVINPQSVAARRGLASLPPPLDAPAVGPIFRPSLGPPPGQDQALPPASVSPKELLKTKLVEATCTVDEWLDCLRNVVEYDIEGDRLRPLLGWAAAIALLSAFILTFIARSPIPLVFCLPVGVFAFIAYRMMKRKDIPNSLRLFVVPLIAVLREDMRPEAQLSLRLDLRGKTLTDKQLHQQSYTVGAGRYPQVVDTYYRDPWISLAAPLADGSVLEWRITDRIRQRKITRYSPRGKKKTKYKYKIKSVIDVRIRLRQDRYTVAAGAEGAILPLGQSSAIKPGRKRTTIHYRRILESREPNAVPEPKILLDLIAGAYQQVRPTRED